MKQTKWIHKNQGFTVIELMVATLIAAIITGAIGSFLVMHIKSFEVTKDLVDIQYDSQIALNGLGEIVMESRGMTYLTDSSSPTFGDNEVSDLSLSVNPIAFAFEKTDGSVVLFLYENTSKTLWFSEPADDVIAYDLSVDADEVNDSWFVYLDHLDGLELSSQTSGVSFADSDALYIVLDMKDKESTLEVSDVFKMRNKR